MALSSIAVVFGVAFWLARTLDANHATSREEMLQAQIAENAELLAWEASAYFTWDSVVSAIEAGELQSFERLVLGVFDEPLQAEHILIYEPDGTPFAAYTRGGEGSDATVFEHFDARYVIDLGSCLAERVLS